MHFIYIADVMAKSSSCYKCYNTFAVSIVAWGEERLQFAWSQVYRVRSQLWTSPLIWRTFEH